MLKKWPSQEMRKMLLERNGKSYFKFSWRKNASRERRRSAGRVKTVKEAQQEYVFKRRMGGSPNNFQELKDIIRKKKNQRTSKEAQRAKFINRFGIKLSRSDFIGVLV